MTSFSTPHVTSHTRTLTFKMQINVFHFPILGYCIYDIAPCCLHASTTEMHTPLNLRYIYRNSQSLESERLFTYEVKICLIYTLTELKTVN